MYMYMYIYMYKESGSNEHGHEVWEEELSHVTLPNIQKRDFFERKGFV